MKSHFGDEYPEAVTINGVKMTLVSERRWKRTYASADGKMRCEVSRFMDGSASIILQDFVREWPTWNEHERRDFCGASSWLHKQADYPDILRHIMQHGGPEHWSAIACSVGLRLPQDESFELLTRALHSTDLEHACNISQGISLTKHPGAERVLLAHLAALWAHPSFWANDEFVNLFAYGATCCIGHLIAVGAQPENFAQQVRALSAHPCSGNRASCRRFLHKHFPWLSDSTDATGNA